MRHELVRPDERAPSMTPRKIQMRASQLRRARAMLDGLPGGRGLNIATRRWTARRRSAQGSPARRSGNAHGGWRVRRLVVLDASKKLVGMLSIDDVALHSPTLAGEIVEHVRAPERPIVRGPWPWWESPEI